MTLRPARLPLSLPRSLRWILFAGFGLTLAGAAAPAAADVRCVAAAFTARGYELPRTRAAAVHFAERRACDAAVRRCERRLDRYRYRTGERRPFARCDVIRAAYFNAPRYRDYGYRHDRYRDHRYRDYRDDRYRGDRYRDYGHAPRCNYRACELRYRSFRASDCTFQPYHGPRKLCAL